MPKTSEPAGYWWCPNDKQEVDASTVTFQELHNFCGHPAATPWGTCYRCEVYEAGNDSYRDFVDDDEEEQ